MDVTWAGAVAAIAAVIAITIQVLTRFSIVRGRLDEAIAKVREEHQASISSLRMEREGRMRELDQYIRGLQAENERRCAAIDALSEKRCAEIGETAERERRMHADAMNALRQKINDVGAEAQKVQLVAYKEFVRRDTFMDVLDRYSKETAANRQETLARFDRLDARIERLVSEIQKKDD